MCHIRISLLKRNNKSKYQRLKQIMSLQMGTRGTQVNNSIVTGCFKSMNLLLHFQINTTLFPIAWKILWTGEPGRLQSMGSQRVRHERLHFHFSLAIPSLLILALCFVHFKIIKSLSSKSLNYFNFLKRFLPLVV